MIEELKRKSFIAVTDLTKKEVTSEDFVKNLKKRFKTAKPYAAFLSEAIGVTF